MGIFEEAEISLCINLCSLRIELMDSFTLEIRLSRLKRILYK